MEFRIGGDCLEQKKVTRQLAKYLQENMIQTKQVSLDTNVPEEKLRVDGKEDLSAGEFLSLCQYLNIQPELFLKER